MKCKTCSHPQRPAIDLALLTENHTFESLGQKFGLSISSLFRHKQHLVEKMRQARRRLKDSQAQVSLLKLNAILDHVQHAVQTAEAESKIDSVFRGSHVGSRIIHQINKMEVPLELDTVYRLISSPQWVCRDSLYPTDPQIISDIHQAVVDDAFFPCPEPNPESLADDDYDRDADDEDDLEDDEADPRETEAEDDGTGCEEDYEKDEEDSEPIVAAPATDFEAFLKTGNCRTETELKLATALQQLLHRLDLTVDSIPETAPKNQREITEKLSKNFRLPGINYDNYQIDSLWRKNLPENSFSLPVSPQPAVNPARNSDLETPVILSPLLPYIAPTHLETRNSELETLFFPPLPFPVPPAARSTKNSNLEACLFPYPLSFFPASSSFFPRPSPLSLLIFHFLWQYSPFPFHLSPAP